MVVGLQLLRDEQGGWFCVTDIPGAGSAGRSNDIITSVQEKEDGLGFTFDIGKLLEAVFEHVQLHIEGSQAFIRDQAAIIEEHGL